MGGTNLNLKTRSVGGTNLTLHQSHPAPISTGGWFRLNAGYPFVMGGVQVSPREASHLQEPLVPRWGEPIAGKTQDWWVAPISKGGWHQLEEGGPFFMGSFGRVSLGRVLSPPGTFGASMDRSDGPSKIAGKTRDRWVAPISKGGWYRSQEVGGTNHTRSVGGTNWMKCTSFWGILSAVVRTKANSLGASPVWALATGIEVFFTLSTPARRG